MYFNRFSQLVILSCFALVALFVLPGRTQAGLLSDFEHEATKPSFEEKRHSYLGHDDDDDDDLAECLGFCLGIFFKAVTDSSADTATATGADSAVRNVPGRPAEVEPVPVADMGSGPLIRFDYGYQDVESDVTAHDFRLEFGWPNLGFQVRETHYEESSPEDDLDIIEAHLLIRFSGEYLDLGLGPGLFSLQGNESHTGAAFTLPLAVHVYESLDVEFRPAWAYIKGNSISDYDLAVSWGWQYLALRGGYRWMLTHGQSLNGPYLGVSLRF